MWILIFRVMDGMTGDTETNGCRMTAGDATAGKTGGRTEIAEREVAAGRRSVIENVTEIATATATFIDGERRRN